MVGEYQNGGDLRLVMEKRVEDFEKISKVSMPTISDEDKKDSTLLLLYGKKVDIYFKRQQTYVDNQTKLYQVIFGQCIPTWEANIRSLNEFTDRDEAKDIFWLLDVVKRLSVSINDSHIIYLTSILMPNN